MLFRDMTILKFMMSAIIVGKFGKITLPGLLGVSPWVVIPVLTAAYLALFRMFEQKKI